MTRQIQTQLGARDTNRLILAFLVAIAADVVFVFFAQIPILNFVIALAVFALLTPILGSKKVNALLAVQAPALLGLIRIPLVIAGVTESIPLLNFVPAWTIAVAIVAVSNPPRLPVARAQAR